MDAVKNSKATTEVDVDMEPSQESDQPVKKLVRNRKKKVVIDSELDEQEQHQLNKKPKAPVDDALDVSEEEAVEEIEDLCSQQAIKAKSLAHRMSTGDLATKAGPKAFKTATKTAAAQISGPQKLKPKPGFKIVEKTVIEEDDKGYTKVV